MENKRSLLYLLRYAESRKASYAYLVKQLKPRFGEKGTNQRVLEENRYRVFLEYLKEVHGKHTNLGRII